MEMMMKELFLTKGGGSEVGKERETRFSLTSCRTRKQRQDEPISHRKQHCFTSLSENGKHHGHETPPENPATELNTNSTLNTPDHSSVQQTPADETPQVPETAGFVVCHSSEENQISSDILNVSSQTPVPQLLPVGRELSHRPEAIQNTEAKTSKSTTCLNTCLNTACDRITYTGDHRGPKAPQMTKPMPSPKQVHYMKSPGHFMPSHIAISPQFAAEDLLTLQNADSSLRTMAAHMSDPLEHPISSTDLNTSSELRTLHSCCICETVFSRMSLSHSLRQSS